MGAAAISGLKRGPVQTRSRLSKLVYFKQLYFTAVGPGDRNFPSKNPQPDRKPSRVNFDADPLFLPPSLPLLNPVSVFLPSMIFSSTFFALLPPPSTRYFKYHERKYIHYTRVARMAKRWSGFLSPSKVSRAGKRWYFFSSRFPPSAQRRERERESGKLVGGIFRRWGGRCFFEIQWADLTRLEARLNNNKRYAWPWNDNFSQVLPPLLEFTFG